MVITSSDLSSVPPFSNTGPPPRIGMFDEGRWSEEEIALLVIAQEENPTSNFAIIKAAMGTKRSISSVRNSWARVDELAKRCWKRSDSAIDERGDGEAEAEDADEMDESSEESDSESDGSESDTPLAKATLSTSQKLGPASASRGCLPRAISGTPWTIQERLKLKLAMSDPDPDMQLICSQLPGRSLSSIRNQMAYLRGRDLMPTVLPSSNLKKTESRPGARRVGDRVLSLLADGSLASFYRWVNEEKKVFKQLVKSGKYQSWEDVATALKTEGFTERSTRALVNQASRMGLSLPDGIIGRPSDHVQLTTKQASLSPDPESERESIDIEIDNEYGANSDEEPGWTEIMTSSYWKDISDLQQSDLPFARKRVSGRLSSCTSSLLKVIPEDVDSSSDYESSDDDYRFTSLSIPSTSPSSCPTPRSSSEFTEVSETKVHKFLPKRNRPSEVRAKGFGRRVFSGKRWEADDDAVFVKLKQGGASWDELEQRFTPRTKWALKQRWTKVLEPRLKALSDTTGDTEMRVDPQEIGAVSEGKVRSKKRQLSVSEVGGTEKRFRSEE